MNQYNHEPALCVECGATIPHSAVRLCLGMTYQIVICPTCRLNKDFRERHLAHLPIKPRERRPRPDSSPNAEALRELRESYGYFEKKEEHAEKTTE